MGWAPGYAPLGYLNHRQSSGVSIIVEDPDRFQLVRRMWDLLLSRQYSVRQILDIATNEWGLTTPAQTSRILFAAQPYENVRWQMVDVYG